MISGATESSFATSNILKLDFSTESVSDTTNNLPAATNFFNIGTPN